mgnify:CR=1 FL=1
MSTNIRMTRLKKKLELYNRIVIYGAGHLAQILNAELVENCILAKYCIVTHKNKKEEKFQNMPLFEFNDCILDMQKDDVITLIAVTELYEEEIEKTLLRHEVKNYLFVTRFVRQATSFDIYKEKSQGEYIDEISEWYVDKLKLTWNNVAITRKRLEHIIIEKKYDENKIVFVVGNVAPRVIKMLEALGNKGYKIKVLFYPNVLKNNIFTERIVHLSDDYTWCESIEEVMYHIISSNSKVVHIFSHAAISYMSCILLNQKALFPKLVFEQYDIINSMYIQTYTSKKNFEDERYCLEHAEWICCRGNEQEFLIQKMHYKIRGNIIKFFDYCQDRMMTKEKQYNKKELSLCYAGGIASEREWPGASYACFLEFAEICEKNKCHFHVYPSRWDENRFADYIELDGKSEYFHFHKPVSFEQLRKELSQYDYGVHPIKSDFINKEINGYYTKEKFIYAATNHFYDYLDAGLPIISAIPVKFAEYFVKEGVLINWVIEEYDFNKLRRRKRELYEKVIKVREKLQIQNHIQELNDFYNN